jgi:hypothetical protein
LEAIVRIAIVSNITNGIGLQKEWELLREFFISEGHEVVGLQYDEPFDESIKADLACFLEVIPRNFLGISERRWMWCNPEWMKPEMIKTAERSCEKIFSKTREAQRILDPLFPGRVHFTGFLCRDQFDSSVKREPIFLHLPGNSLLRGTDAVLDAWRWRRNGKTLDARLIVVGTSKFDCNGLNDDRVTFLERLSEEDLKEMQNRCRFHLMPSATEGFGFALHEALSVGAQLITLNQPPMSEIKNAHLLIGEKAGTYNLADIYRTDAIEIYEMVDQLQKSPDKHLFKEEEIRAEFKEGNELFGKAMREHLGSSQKKIVRSAQRVDGKPCMAFLGNFEAQESTESMIRWALEERLGYNVELLQENKVNMSAVREAMEWNDMFLWVRTPGWLQAADSEVLRFLEDMRKKKKKTLSVHLDKFWGIPEREKKIGIDPFWLTEEVWTADGSRQDDFKKRGVNHFWMKPAISEEYCHPGRNYEHLRSDVLFVGAKDYHAEYPFRRQLVEWLEQTYGERFKHVTNVRGHELNNVYASAKVVVGDCIFAGTPSYWSDRVPETVGRFGFLIHPTVPELSILSCIFYRPQDLEDLERVIEKCLSYSDQERKDWTVEAAEIVRRNDTWTVRLREILGLV